MIVWINGPFGAGKTTTANLVVDQMPDARLFDSEIVGYFLRRFLEDAKPVSDFQEWRAWRTLVVDTAAALLDELDGTLVVPQSVHVEQYWDELAGGLADRGVPLAAFTLDVAPDELARRIDSDTVEPDAAQWRHEKAADYAAALPWLRRVTTVIDTTALSPDAVAAVVIGHLE